MTTGLDACLGIEPVNPCPLVDMAKANLVDGFVPSFGDRIPAQIAVGSDRAAGLDDQPQFRRTLRTDSHTFYQLVGLGLTPPDDASSCPTCEDCDVSECLLSPFSFLPVGYYACFWRDGRFHLRFAFRDRGELSASVAALREAGYRVGLEHLSRDDAQFDATADVHFDLGSLTDRQREALRLAAESDYFGDSGTDVSTLAAELDVSASTFSGHVRAGVRRLLQQLFDPDDAT